MLYKSGVNLSSSVKEFIEGSRDLYIFVPYIKLIPLKELLLNSYNCKAIVVRWEPRDLIFGSSDLEVFQFCKENNIALYRNPRIHLKAYIDNFTKGLIGSANISSRALDLPPSGRYNYELATIVRDLTLEDRLYLNIILNESILITDAIFDQIKSQLPEKKIEFPEEKEFVLNPTIQDKAFLISSLPMSYSVLEMLEIYETGVAENDTKMNCFVHDVALYEITLNEQIELVLTKLKTSFFNHPFIAAFINEVEERGEIYFGEAKKWIHYNCTDVPLPRRWEITVNIQILYRWIVELGDGKYVIDIPGSFSERLKIVK